MAFVTGSDVSGQIEVTVFARQYQKFKSILVPKQVLLLSGQVKRKMTLNFIAQSIEIAKEITLPKLYLRLPVGFTNKQALQQILYNFSGQNEVVIYEVATDAKFLLNNKICLTDELLIKLKSLLGQDNVVVK